MNCPHCEGPLHRAPAPFHIDHGSVHLDLDAVPAWVCEQCGEALFDAADVDTIQAILRVVEELPRPSPHPTRTPTTTT